MNEFAVVHHELFQLGDIIRLLLRSGNETLAPVGVVDNRFCYLQYPVADHLDDIIVILLRGWADWSAKRKFYAFSQHFPTYPASLLRGEIFPVGLEAEDVRASVL